jgi:hypothetical protein
LPFGYLKRHRLKLAMRKTTVVERVLVISGITCFVALMLLSAYFLGHMPRNVQPEVGRVYAFNQHGWIVYLTLREHVLFNLLLWMSGILFVWGASLHLSRR